jgi:hypothetical protein
VLAGVLELHAMEIAERHYESAGWDVDTVSDRMTFDLLCKSENGDVLHVEVKGTTGDGSQILLTAGEVDHALAASTDLFIVHGVTVSGSHDPPVAAGGVINVIPQWIPLDESSSPIAFKYTGLNSSRMSTPTVE